MAFDPVNYEGQDRLAHIEKYVGQNTAAIAVLNGGGTTYLAQLAMANDGPVANVKPDLSLLVASEGTTLTFATGYAGNDVVEPSILYDVRAPFFADTNGQNGYEYVACIGGYSGSNALYENPNLWVSHDGDTWVYVVFSGGVGTPTPAYGGVLTPIVPSGVQGDGLLSDPYLVRGPDGTYFILWNQALVATGSGGTGTGSNTWSVKGISASSLAGPWSSPVTLLVSNGATAKVSSPSALYDGTKWHIYSIDLVNTSSTTFTHHTVASTNLLSTWVAASAPSIPMPAAYSSQVFWHHNAYRWGNVHLLIVQDTAAGTSGAGNLWAIYSTDGGTTWTVPSTPMLAGQVYYRSAIVMSERGYGLEFDLFYGALRTNFFIGRGTAYFKLPERIAAKYGGVGLNGIPVNSEAVAIARTPIPPYLMGDTCIRANSAVTPGTTDSGTAYTISTGTLGISGNQLYVVVAANARAIAAVAGLADSVSTCEFSAIDTAAQQWFIVRWVDASNYVRVGYNTTSGYQIQNIVAGSVTQTLVFTGAGINGTGVWAPVSGDVLGVVCLGTTVTVYLNGVRIGQATGYTNNAAGSGIGIQANTTSNARWRNLTARTLVGGV